MAKAIVDSKPIKELKKKGEEIAEEVKEAAYSPLMDQLTRLGYAVKGFLYIAIGFIAIAGALGRTATPADQLGAIVEFSEMPFAQIILWVILLGLISYSLWGVVRAILDPFHKGTKLEGLLMRLGYLVSAITYATFVWPTYQLIIGASEGKGTDATVELVSKVMNMPLGHWLVGGFGVSAIIAGLVQIYMGLKPHFEQRFKPYSLTSEQMMIARRIGRFGTVARGIVFGIAGGFLVLAAWQSNPGQARGFNGALDFLADQPYGIYLLGIVAAGFIAFGLYSFVGAAWFKFKK
jgi:hypothetical protein